MGFVIGAFPPWVYWSRWVSDDATGLKVRPVFWNTILLLCGVAGLLLFLVTPSFVGGLLLTLLFVGVPLDCTSTNAMSACPNRAK